MSQHTPKHTLWAGIVIVASGVLVLILGGNLIPNVAIFADPSGQALFSLVSMLLSAIQFVALPLGSALIAAGLVMRYIRSLHERPFAHLDTEAE